MYHCLPDASFGRKEPNGLSLLKNSLALKQNFVLLTSSSWSPWHSLPIYDHNPIQLASLLRWICHSPSISFRTGADGPSSSFHSLSQTYLENIGKISEIEDVVEFDCRGQERGGNFLVEGNS